MPGPVLKQSASAAMPTLRQTHDGEWFFKADGAEWKSALQAAWPDVRVNLFKVRLDERRDNSDLAGRMTFDINVSGNRADVVSRGLVTDAQLSSLPPCGYARRSGRNITLTKAGRVRLALYFDSEEQAFNLLVSSLSSLVWKPGLKAPEK